MEFRVCLACNSAFRVVMDISFQIRAILGEAGIVQRVTCLGDFFRLPIGGLNRQQTCNIPNHRPPDLPASPVGLINAVTPQVENPGVFCTRVSLILLWFTFAVSSLIQSIHDCRYRHGIANAGVGFWASTAGLQTKRRCVTAIAMHWYNTLCKKRILQSCRGCSTCGSCA
jgi:hypothetical protein